MHITLPLSALRCLGLGMVSIALLMAVGLLFLKEATPEVHAAPEVSDDAREAELALAFVQAQALNERGYGSLAQLLLSTERRFKHRREAFFVALNGFRVLHAQCMAIEEKASAMGDAQTEKASEQCSADLRKAAGRVTSFPEEEPAFLEAMDAWRVRYWRCEGMRKEADASGSAAMRLAWERCSAEVNDTPQRMRAAFPNLEWLE